MSAIPVLSEVLLCNTRSISWPFAASMLSGLRSFQQHFIGMPKLIQLSVIMQQRSFEENLDTHYTAWAKI